MKIDSYTVGMSSSSVSVKSYSVTEKMTVDFANNPASGNQNSGNQGAAVLTLSPEAQEQSANRNWNGNENEHTAVRAAGKPQDFGGYSEGDMKIFLLERLLESFTGKKYKFRPVDKFHPDNNNNNYNNNVLNNMNNILSGQKAQPTQKQPPLVLLNGRPAPLVSFERTESYHEFQQMSFQATGLVNTSDGRQIQFDLNVLTSYEFSSSSSVAIQGGKLCDPLIINFDGALPELTKDRYAFDITIDGLAENIFMPTNGSGFLALDKDGNGKIDDGSELFGASSGDGFWELAAYDSDGNGWIDEGDEIFSQLKLMSVDKDSGEFVLVSLKDSGVGAIFLGSTAANYEIKGDNNELAGVVRRSGVFLNENGSAGTIHHIDLTY